MTPENKPLSFEWFPNWSGETAIIVAAGPSAKGVPLANAKGLARVLCVNNSWQLAPWADALYGCDYRWWLTHKGVPEFRGLKISQDPKCRQWPEIKIVETLRGRNEILTEKQGLIGWGGNGGFHSLNLAVQFGAKRIVLVGFDMTLKHGVHWHGRHMRGLTDPNDRTVEKWRGVLDKAAPTFNRLGVEVLNASEISTLKSYPKVRFSELFPAPASSSLAA